MERNLLLRIDGNTWPTSFEVYLDGCQNISSLKAKKKGKHDMACTNCEVQHYARLWYDISKQANEKESNIMSTKSKDYVLNKVEELK